MPYQTQIEDPILQSSESESQSQVEEDSEGTTMRRSNKSSNFCKNSNLSTTSHHHHHRRRSQGNNQDAGDVHKPHHVDDLIFDLFVEGQQQKTILAGKFLAALEKTGLRRTDQRLRELNDNLREELRKKESSFSKRNFGSIETLQIDRPTFKRLIMDNIVLISRAFRQQFIIPEFQTFCEQMESLYLKCKNIRGGQVADYIPHLARVSPDYWGVSICTIDGQRFSFGDTTIPLTLQSLCKPILYAIALNELGKDVVHKYVGQEPAGQFPSELHLDYNQKPHNSLLSAGAIIVASILKSIFRPEMTNAEKFDYMHNYLSRLCGGEYNGFNNAVFLSEREASDRNYALAFYMREHHCFPEGVDLEACVDYYLQCLSMQSNCDSLAVISATLANGGICPTTSEQVLKAESVRDVLSLMQSCGMYDYSGKFAFKVGLPAKGSRCGTIMLVVPNVLGLAVWGPGLDNFGNSMKGVAFCESLVNQFSFHNYEDQRHNRHKIDPIRQRHETKGFNIVNLLFAAASGDLTSMRRHHLAGMDMNSPDYDGRTALHLAAAEGHLECVQYLLRQCQVNCKPVDRWGYRPIDDAERFKHVQVAAVLNKWEDGEDDD